MSEPLVVSKDEMIFPWRYFALNILLMFIGRYWKNGALMPYDPFFSALLFISFLAVLEMIGLFVLSSMYQLLMFILFRRVFHKKIVWLCIFVAPGVLSVCSAASWAHYVNMPSTQVMMILADGRLAPLPPDAKGVQTYIWSSRFTGDSYLMFEASPEQIEDFIRNSPSLKAVTPSVFSKDCINIPYPKDRDTNHGYADSEKCRYYFPHAWQPSWYSEELRDKGRIYIIPDEDHHNWGSVTIDDVKNTVYIVVIWS